MEIRTIVDEFAHKLAALVEAEAIERARQAVVAAFGASAPIAARRGRPPKAAGPVVTVARRNRRKPPRQLCPVPGCKNSAAPVFGMVCSEHKNVAKSKIRKYRDARRAAKTGA
jgi:hypothetical protein